MIPTEGTASPAAPDRAKRLTCAGIDRETVACSEGPAAWPHTDPKPALCRRDHRHTAASTGAGPA